MAPESVWKKEVEWSSAGERASVNQGEVRFTVMGWCARCSESSQPIDKITAGPGREIKARGCRAGRRASGW